MAGRDLGAWPAAHIRWPEDTVFARISLLAGWPSVPVAKTRTGRSRLERCQGWQSAVMARRDPVRCPVFWVGRLNGSLLGCLRKDVVLCDTASWAWVGKRGNTLGGRRISCAPSECKSGTVLDLYSGLENGLGPKNVIVCMEYNGIYERRSWIY